MVADDENYVRVQFLSAAPSYPHTHTKLTNDDGTTTNNVVRRNLVERKHPPSRPVHFRLAKFLD